MSRSRLTSLSFGLLFVIVVANVAISVVTGDWGLLIIMGAAAVAYALVFWSKLNRDRVVSTEHGEVGRAEAVEFFWRPG
jgi:hypothetical protein